DRRRMLQHRLSPSRPICQWPLAFPDPVPRPLAAAAAALLVALCDAAPVPTRVHGHRRVAIGLPEGPVAVEAADEVAHRPLAKQVCKSVARFSQCDAAGGLDHDSSASDSGAATGTAA